LPKQTKAQKTHAAIQRASNERKTKAGWRRRGVWVPPDGEELFNAAITKLKKQFVKYQLI
jgi:hypothetical protein